MVALLKHVGEEEQCTEMKQKPIDKLPGSLRDERGRTIFPFSSDECNAGVTIPTSKEECHVKPTETGDIDCQIQEWEHF